MSQSVDAGLAVVYCVTSVCGQPRRSVDSEGFPQTRQFRQPPTSNSHLKMGNIKPSISLD